MSTSNNRVNAVTAFVAGIALLLLSVVPAGAATQGAAGPTSTGAVTITATTGVVARIAGLTDVNLGIWSGTGPLTANNDVCVGRSGVGLFATGLFHLRADGDGSPSDVTAFTLSNGADLLHYDAYFNDQTGLAGRTQLTGGLMISGQTGFGFWQILNVIFGCAVNNANVSVEIPEANLSAAAGGVYTGTLTLTLIPE